MEIDGFKIDLNRENGKIKISIKNETLDFSVIEAKRIISLIGIAISDCEVAEEFRKKMKTIYKGYNSHGKDLNDKKIISVFGKE